MRIYRSQNDKYTIKKTIISVWLVDHGEGDWKMYFCPDCRNAIAQYKGNIVMEVPGSTPEKTPVMIQCKNPRCGRKIQFEDIVKHDLV